MRPRASQPGVVAILSPLLLLLAVLAWSAPAAAGLAPATVPSEEPAPPISLEAASDEAVTKRLQAIFDEVPSFGEITVEVSGGVVHLRGTAPSAQDREAASKLAQRLQGVVYVDNAVEVSTEVGGRVVPVWERLQQMLYRAYAYLPIALIALGVLFVFWLLSQLIGMIPSHRFGATLLGSLLRQLARAAVILLGLILALDLLGLTPVIGAVLGAAGVFGLALGFGLKDIVENYLAGLILSVRSPFAIKDWVEVEGNEGSVVRMTSRELVLMTLDGNHVRLPNAQVFRATIINYTRNPLRAFRFWVGVGVAEELAAVQKLGVDTLAAVRGVLADPPPNMRVKELGDFNIVIEFQGWVDQRNFDFLKVRSEALRILKTAFQASGVDMPEPSQTVHLLREDQAPAAVPTLVEAPAPVREQAQQADVGRETFLDAQIAEDDIRSGDANILAPKSGKSQDTKTKETS